MKNIFKLTALAVFLCCLVSCDDDEPIIPTLEVTPANLNGTWELSEWNGTPLAEGTYCYITFNRKEQTFEMYQKFDSMYARYITGSFSIRKYRKTLLRKQKWTRASKADFSVFFS